MYEKPYQIIHLIRIKHWIKNIVILFPIFFAGDIYKIRSSEILILTLLFCLVSSIVYIINDIVDIADDQRHSIKRFRPIASGAITVSESKIILTFLLSLSVIISVLYFHSSHMYVLAYFILNLSYTFVLKHIIIVDVMSISIGFVLRLFSGSDAGQVFLSNWMVLVVFLLMHSIALAKRREALDEIILSSSDDWPKVSGYTSRFLDIATSISFILTMIVYILYTTSDDSIERMDSPHLYLTSPFVLAGILRYLQLYFTSIQNRSPVHIVLTDRLLQMSILCWILTFIYIIYGNYI